MESGWPEARCMVRKIPKVRRMRTGRKKQSLRSLSVMKMDVRNKSQKGIHWYSIHLNVFSLNLFKFLEFTQGFPLLPAITACPGNTAHDCHWTHIEIKEIQKKGGKKKDRRCYYARPFYRSGGFLSALKRNARPYINNKNIFFFSLHLFLFRLFFTLYNPQRQERE